MPKPVDVLKQFALSRGLWIERVVSDDKVRGLIRKLRPVANRRGLARFGPAKDGGYLMPDDLDGVALCISPGVSSEVGFDHAIAERGIAVLMADASVAGPPNPHPKFKFLKKFIGTTSGGDLIRLDDLAAQEKGDGDIVLQMDIEGAEWDAILDMSDALLKRIRIAVIEVHALDQIFSASGFRRVENFFEKMRRHHEIVHVHPNNVSTVMRRGDIEVPRIMEFTFYRRDRDQFDAAAQAPARHPLDADNVSYRPRLDLPAVWR